MTTSSSITVRFAPSPTGYLHIGGARTALFNYLFAKRHGGQFLLRVEDTDKARSTDAAIAAIYDGLEWLGLTPDAPPVLQSTRADRHRAVVQELLTRGSAYHCYMTAEELGEKRAAATAKGETYRYDGRWRDASPADAPAGITPSVRLKAPREGSITIHDAVLGSVTVACNELDDMVLLRADGTPTYLLAVVVDDHDMGITQIIRGDDHFTNSFRQALIYNALGWTIPQMAHLPLIHGADGAKLSKRHGALGVNEYRDTLGYLPEAVRNYLLRLGWAHGDAEIISDAEAISWFSLEGLGKSPARFDFAKLDALNAHYMREADTDRLYALALPFIEKRLARTLKAEEHRLLRAVFPELQARATTLVELAEQTLFLFVRPADYTDKARAMLEKDAALLPALCDAMQGWEWDASAIEAECKAFAAAHNVKLGEVMNPLRAAITGSHASPSMFHLLPLMGKEECVGRVESTLRNIT
jgi:glutamyl-tRNA synthetase